MPVLVRYCNKCGIRISPLDLEMGKAVQHKGGYYCAKCSEGLVVVAEVVEEEKSPGLRKTPPANHKQAVHIRPDRIPVRHASKDRPRHEDAQKGEYRQSSTNLLPLYILIVGVFVALVIIVILVNRPHQPPPGPPEPQPQPVIGNGGLPPEPGRKTSGGVDADRQQKLREELNKIIKHAGDDAKDIKTAIAKLNMFLKQPGLSMTLANEAKSHLNNYSKKIRNLSDSELKKTLTNVKTLVKELKFDEALKVLEEFPEVYINVKLARDLDKETQRVAFERGAHGKYIEAVKASEKALEEGGFEQARDKLGKWLEEFGTTLHAGEVKERHGAVIEKIKERDRKRRIEAQKELEKLKKLAAGLAEKKEYKKAVDVLRDFIKKYPNEKVLIEKANSLAGAYEKLLQKQVAEASKEPKEPRFRLDFTGSSEVSSMKDYKYEAAAVKSTANGANYLSMPAPEGSVLKAQFEIEKVPGKLVLALEHAGAERKPGRTKKVFIDIKLNDKVVQKSYEVAESFRIDPFKITSFVKKGLNKLEISPAKQTKAAYRLKRVGIAEKLDNAFKPLEEEKAAASGGEGKEDSPAEGSIFGGKTLKGWNTSGPGKWEVKNGIITGKHTGEGRPDDVGFVFPSGKDSGKWLDYKVSFEVKCNVAGGWKVAVRARESTGGLVSGNLLDAGEGFAKDKWWKISLRVKGGTVYASVNGSDEFEQGKDPDQLPGTFAFGVKLGAIVEFKNIQFELNKKK